MQYPLFVGSAYTSQSPIADAERCVNWYLEQMESPGAKTTSVLYPAPGFAEFCEAGNGPIRGLFTQNGRTFVVSGSELYELFQNGTSLLRGEGLNAIDGTPCTINGNGDAGHQLFITSASKGYVYDLTSNILTFVLDNSSYGGFIDGFFLSLDPQRSEFRISDLEDGSNWDALQIAQRNAASDRWASMIVNHKEIWLFGTQTSEVWYNAGAAPFPFQPNPNVFIQHGILAPQSVAILENSPIWLGQSLDGAGVVYRANGYTPVRVSTHALEYALSTYGTLLDAVAWVYQDQGHYFYILTFPSQGVTWVYDAATSQWHERGSWNGERYVELPIYGHTYAFTKHLTGSRTTGTIYRQSVQLATDVNGKGLRRTRRAPHLANEQKRIIYDQLQIDLEVGLGLSEGPSEDPPVQGSDPQMMLRWSDDGGQTWGNEHWESAGKQGQYLRRVIWRRLGQARDRVFELSVSDPTPWRLNGAFLSARPGPN